LRRCIRAAVHLSCVRQPPSAIKKPSKAGLSLLGLVGVVAERVVTSH
jgi:hypothetical protein